MIIAGAVATASVVGAIWAWGQGEAAKEKAKKEGKGLEKFWEQMPIVLIISVISIVIMIGILITKKSVKEVITGSK